MLNAVTWRDANLLPFVNKFSKEFARYHIASLVNFYFEYDQ